MDMLLIVSIYLLLGACWTNIADEYIFKDMKGKHKFVSFIFWPLDILMGGMTRGVK